MSEAEMAAVLIEYLRADGWTIYQEVQVRSYGSVADIVATRNGEVLVVETKKTFGLGVLGQAFHWKNHAHYVAIGVPTPQRQTKSQFFGEQVAWKFGIGVFHVGSSLSYTREKIAPRKNERADVKQILETLTEDHKTYAAAGNADGKRLTKFRITINRLIEYVEANPECTLKDAVKAIEHHYANDYSAKSSLAKQIVRFGNVPELFGAWDVKSKAVRLRVRSRYRSLHKPRRRPLDSVRDERP